VGGVGVFEVDSREPVTRIELALSAWKADVPPQHFTGVALKFIAGFLREVLPHILPLKVSVALDAVVGFSVGLLFCVVTVGG